MIAAPHMGGRHGEKALHDARRRIGFAETVAPVCIDDLHDDRFHRPVEVVARLAGHDHRDDFDGFDGSH